MEIVFATNNQHKLEEIVTLLAPIYRVIGLKELGINEDIPEDHETLEENAHQKACFVFERSGKDCFADDTGLEVDALNGAPGVYSARFATMGSPRYPEMEPAEGNIQKLLELMEGEQNRKARFRTVITLILEGQSYYFEGEVKGTITEGQSGKEGFGYDPVFLPDGYDRTFAEMDLQMKNRISHRARAVGKLVDFLQKK